MRPKSKITEKPARKIPEISGEGNLRGDRKAAANQDRHEKKIKEVAVAYPYGKAVRTREVVGVYLGNSGNSRHSEDREFDPGRGNQRQDRTSGSDQDRWPNPDTKPAIGRMVDSSVRCIECDHIRFIGDLTDVPFLTNRRSPRQ